MGKSNGLCSSLATIVCGLAACGGGGADPEAGDPIDKYLGTFRQTDCTQVAGVTDELTGLPLHVRVVTTFTKTGVDRAQAREQLQVYPQAGCEGAPIVTVVSGGELVVDAAQAGPQGGDRVTRSTCGDYFAQTIAGAAVVNGVVFRSYTVPAPQSWKDIFLVRGGQLYMGDFRGGVDAAGYPLGLEDLPQATRG